MKAVFVHDQPVYLYKGEFYNALGSSAWHRYLEVFDELEFVGRGRYLDNQLSIEKLNTASHPNVRINPIYSVSGGIDYIVNKKEINEHLKEVIKSADIVIARLPSFLGMCAIELCINSNKPYSVEVVGCAWDAYWNYGGILTKFYAPFSYYKVKKLVKNAKSAIYVTEHFLQGRYPTNASIKSHASNVIIDDYKVDILNRHQTLIESERDVYNIAFLANIDVKYKGFDVLLKALSLAKNSLSKPIHLYLYGDGKGEWVRSLINKYHLNNEVTIKGLLKSKSEVNAALDELDIYVHPSRQEGLPRAVIEAMSRGCPVLASSVAGTPELLEKDYMHKPGDYKQLAHQLVSLLEDKATLLAMSEINFNRAKLYRREILEQKRREFWHETRKLFVDNKA